MRTLARMRVVAAFVMLAVGSCTCAPRSVELVPMELVFPVTAVGSSSELMVPSIRTAGLAKPEWTIDDTPPFEVIERPASIVRWHVRFQPTSAGTFTSTLHVAGNGFSGKVRVIGSTIAPPACPRQPGPCGRLDAATCAIVPSREGERCSDACVTAGTCRAGTCEGGTERSCDDGNPCTLDHCEPDGGCRHITYDRCQNSSGQACQRGRCDPTRGCVFEPVADGVPCGPWECRDAWTCRAGTCEPPPLDPGEAECAPMATTKLRRAWSSDEAAEAVVSDGELRSAYLTGRPLAMLVGRDRDGRERFRFPLALQPLFHDFWWGSNLLAGNVLLTSVGTAEMFGDLGSAGIEAHRWSDGALLWTRTWSALLGEDPASGPFDGQPVLRVSGETVLALAGSSHSQQRTWLVLSTSTGDVLSRAMAAAHDFVASDGDGTLFWSSSRAGGTGYVGSEDAAFSARWRFTSPVGSGFGIVPAPGVVLVPNGAVLDARTGLPVDGRTLPDGALRWAGESGYAIRGGRCEPVRTTRFALSRAGVEASCALPSADFLSSAVVTSRGTNLLALTAYVPSADDRHPHALIELDPAGRVVQALELETFETIPLDLVEWPLPSIVGLSRGRVLVSSGKLDAYDLPDPVDAPADGWIAGGGSFDRGLAPR